VLQKAVLRALTQDAYGVRLIRYNGVTIARQFGSASPVTVTLADFTSGACDRGN
jgi:hypothetical protein